MFDINTRNKSFASRVLPSLRVWVIAIVFVLTSFGLPKAAKAQNPDSLLNFIEDLTRFALIQNQDSNYIKSYTDLFAVRLVGVHKINFFNIHDKKNSSKLSYRPVRDISLGAGVAYRWFALDITFRLGLSKKPEFDNIKQFDFQARFFTSKQFIATTLQYYNGYKLYKQIGLSNPIPESATNRDDIRTINFNLQYLFAFNYENFSIKAPFVLNEVQRKSAGSVIAGASFSIFSLDADSSIVPYQAYDDFDPLFRMTDMNNIIVSINAGYMYSFVWKERLFLTLGLIPGLNLNSGDYHADRRHFMPPQVGLNLITMNAIGFTYKKFFTGFHYLNDITNISFDSKMVSNIGHGKASFFVGYRF